MNFDIRKVPTPSYVIEEQLLRKNCEILKLVMDRTGCEILLAQKAFSMYSTYPLIGSYLSGTTASSLFEARLGQEEMGKEVHIFAPAYREDEFDEIVSLRDLSQDNELFRRYLTARHAGHDGVSASFLDIGQVPVVAVLDGCLL